MRTLSALNSLLKTNKTGPLFKVLSVLLIIFSQVSAQAEQSCASFFSGSSEIAWKQVKLDSEEAKSLFLVFRDAFDKDAINTYYRNWSIEIKSSFRQDSFDLAEEGVAIDYYKREIGYRDINRFLRGKPLETYSEEGAAAAARLISSALNKMQGPWVYANQLVYRGGSLTKVELAPYQPGATVVEKAFTSTSSQRDSARDFAAGYVEGRERVMFTIYSLSGKIISVWGEAEVLFLPGTTFKVLKREEKDGWVFIEMNEVP